MLTIGIFKRLTGLPGEIEFLGILKKISILNVLCSCQVERLDYTKRHSTIEV